MIEIRCDQTDERAEAFDEISAFIAARTLLHDAWHAKSVQGFKPTATFYVAGEPVLSRVPEASIWHTIGNIKIA